MKRLKIVCISLICILLILFSCGCWDKVEIDRKGFVSVIGIDIGKDIGKEEELKDIKPEEPFYGDELKRLKVTFGYLDISKLGAEKGNSAEEVVITSEGYSMEDAVNSTYEKSSRSAHFGHTRLLLLSADLLMYPKVVKEITDYLQRQPELDRKMFVLITDGDTENFIKYKPFMEKNIENYIYGLMANSKRNATILPVTLNEFLGLIDENGNAVLPNLGFSSDKKDIELTGTSLIKDYEIKGTLSPSETSDIEIMRGKIKGGKKAIFIEGHPAEFSIEGVQRKIKVDKKNGRLNFNIYVNIEGKLKEYPINGKAFSREYLSALEQKFNKSLSTECEKVVLLTQKKYNIDPIGLNDFLRKYHTSEWKNVKDNWGKTYGDSEINVFVETKIRRIGVTE